MTVRENVHQFIDMLPEDCLDDVLDYFTELSEGGEPLAAETQAGIREGLDDIRQGRTIALDEYRRLRGL